MIDASTFANSYNAFWNEYIPTCDRFIRRLNLGGSTRFEPPLLKSNTTNRAVIAEYAFSLFVESNIQDVSAHNKTSSTIEENAWRETRKRLAPFAIQGLKLDRNFDKDAFEEIRAISSSLKKFFRTKNKLLLRPMFNGCGYVDQSEGDVIADDTLFEVKTVDRKFRSSDIKQLLTYSALNLASKQYDYKNIGLYNPRSGLFFEEGLEETCQEISGKSAQALLADIIQTISSGDISR